MLRPPKAPYETTVSSPSPDEPAPAVRRVWMRVTAYCPCRRCCGRWARYRRTASGASVTANGGEFVAADTRFLPFGTRVRLPGYAGGRWVPVLDRGARIKGNRLDVYFTSHTVAKRWGVKWIWVEVLEE